MTAGPCYAGLDSGSWNTKAALVDAAGRLVATAVVRTGADLMEHGILGGYDLGQDYPALKDHMLIAVTEMNSKEDIDTLVEVLSEVSHD